MRSVNQRSCWRHKEEGAKKEANSRRRCWWFSRSRYGPTGDFASKRICCRKEVWGSLQGVFSAEIFSCNITAKDKGIKPQSSNKRFEAAWKEFSHAGFAVVFSYNITAKDRGIKSRSFTRPSTKPPAKSTTDPQLPLPLFTDSILPSLSNTPPISNLGDHIRKSPIKRSQNREHWRLQPKRKSRPRNLLERA